MAATGLSRLSGSHAMKEEAKRQKADLLLSLFLSIKLKNNKRKVEKQPQKIYLAQSSLKNTYQST